MKGNIINANESEDISNVKKFNLLSKKIKRDNKNIIDLPLQNQLEYNISRNKEKKIFEIEHIKRKIKNEPKINNQKKNEFKATVKKEEEKFNKNNSLNENLKILENSKDKFSNDNLQRKCKYLVLNSLIKFINKKLYRIYNGNIGNNFSRKEILTLNKFQINNSNIIYNRFFIKKKISDILSDNISHRYTNYLPQHNKLLIEGLRGDKDENKSLYFNKLFNLTFEDCCAHFIGKKSIEELEGMKCFESIKDKLGKDEKYANTIKFYLENYEKILKNKNPRKRKKISIL